MTPRLPLRPLAGLCSAVSLVACAGTTTAPADADQPLAGVSPTASAPTEAPSTPAPTDAGSPLDRGDGSGPDAASPSPTEPPATRATAAPDWLGTRELPRREDGFGAVTATPVELDPRRIATVDRLAPPRDDTFVSSVSAVPDEVLARSTWEEACPVARADLAYVTVAFRGFDGAAHTGELLLARTVAADIVGVLETMFDAGFPIEEMRIVPRAELDLAPTGDGNNTTAFVCRPVRGRERWSQHAYGTAVDVNPFHNPYVKGDLVLPELASTYTDRDDVRAGMVTPDGPTVTGFDQLGWGWGGRWSSLTDPMHFSLDGT